MAIRGVVFDLGSTLIRRTGLELEREKCAALAAFAASEWNCGDPDALAARLLELRLAGWQRSEERQEEVQAADTIADALRSAGLPASEAILRRAEAVFFEPEVRISRLYPSAIETLEALSGMGLRLAMISNATSHQLIVDITRRHAIDRYFDPLVSSAQHGRTKPHPTIFRHVLERWAIEPDAAVMIGDNLGADILGANTVGMRSILVDIEPHPDNPKFADAVRPSACVTSLTEIATLVRRWSGATDGGARRHED